MVAQHFIPCHVLSVLCGMSFSGDIRKKKHTCIHWDGGRLVDAEMLNQLVPGVDCAQWELSSCAMFQHPCLSLFFPGLVQQVSLVLKGHEVSQRRSTGSRGSPAPTRTSPRRPAPSRQPATTRPRTRERDPGTGWLPAFGVKHGESGVLLFWSAQEFPERFGFRRDMRTTNCRTSTFWLLGGGRTPQKVNDRNRFYLYSFFGK